MSILSVALIVSLLLTSEEETEVPTTGHLNNSLGDAWAQLKSQDVGTVAQSQLTFVILSTHKHVSILCPEQTKFQKAVLNRITLLALYIKNILLEHSWQSAWTKASFVYHFCVIKRLCFCQ